MAGPADLGNSDGGQSHTGSAHPLSTAAHPGPEVSQRLLSKELQSPTYGGDPEAQRGCQPESVSYQKRVTQPEVCLQAGTVVSSSGNWLGDHHREGEEAGMMETFPTGRKAEPAFLHHLSPSHRLLRGCPLGKLSLHLR